nr:MAG TPA: hypothetical protein [Caudoviricetes sp.]
MTTVAQMNLTITNYVSALSDKEQLRFIAQSLKTTQVFPATPLGLSRAVTLFMDTKAHKDEFKAIALPKVTFDEATAKKYLFLSKSGAVRIRELQQIVSLAIQARTKKYVERGAETSYLLIQELKRIDREMGTEFYEHYKMTNPTPVVMVQPTVETTPVEDTPVNDEATNVAETEAVNSAE